MLDNSELPTKWSPRPPPVSHLASRELPAVPLDPEVSRRQREYEEIANLSIQKHHQDIETEEKTTKPWLNQATPTPSITDLTELYSTVLKPHDETSGEAKPRPTSPVSRRLTSTSPPAEDSFLHRIENESEHDGYFHEQASRHHAYEAVKDKIHGTFVITIPGSRSSFSNRLLLTVSARGIPYEIAIDNRLEGLCIRGESKFFDTLSQLVSFYRSNELETPSGEAVLLLHPGFSTEEVPDVKETPQVSSNFVHMAFMQL